MIFTPSPATSAPYADALRVVDDLPAAVKAERLRRGLSVADAAKAVGVSATTLTGVEAGSNFTRATATAVLRWLAG